LWYEGISIGRGAYRVLVGKLEGKRLLGKARRRWEDNIKMDLQKIGWGMDWVDLAQDRDRWWALINAVLNIRFLKKKKRGARGMT